MPESWIWLVPALPLSAAALIGLTCLTRLNRGERSERWTSGLAFYSVLLAFVVCLSITIGSWFTDRPSHIQLISWFGSGSWQVNISFMLDHLALNVATLATALCLLNTRFSINYMHREVGFHRFFMILCLFTGGMSLIILAGNAVLTFVGWEITGISSYLLIGFALERRVAQRNAIWAFVTNRVGDAGFLAAIFAGFAWAGTIEWPDLLDAISHMDMQHSAFLLGAFLIAALAKSAISPFTSWISRALEGPTPSSALFYGSLMVHAGIFLIIRLSPGWQQVPALMGLLVLLGSITALYGFLSGLVQSDVKSSLIFSVIGQIGLMVVECGLGLFNLAAWHLALHATWRTWQFLTAPGLMHFVTERAPAGSRALQGSRFLYACATQNMWLEGFVVKLIIQPVERFASDLRIFDSKVINRIIGLPSIQKARDYSAYAGDQRASESAFAESIGKGQGIAGHLVQEFTSALYWFEEKLILNGGGEQLIKLMRKAGAVLTQLESLLSQPRYLLLIMITILAMVL